MLKGSKKSFALLLAICLLFILGQDLCFVSRHFNGLSDMSYREFTDSIDELRSLGEKEQVEVSPFDALMQQPTKQTDLPTQKIWQNRVCFAVIYLCFFAFFLTLLFAKRKAYSLFAMLPGIAAIAVCTSLLLRNYSLYLLFPAIFLPVFSQACLLNGARQGAATAFHILNSMYVLCFGVFLTGKILIRKLSPAGFWSVKLRGYYFLLIGAVCLLLYCFFFSLRLAGKEKDDREKVFSAQNAAIDYLLGAIATVEILLYLAFHRYVFYAVVTAHVLTMGIFVLLLLGAPPLVFLRDLCKKAMKRLLPQSVDATENDSVPGAETAGA